MKRIAFLIKRKNYYRPLGAIVDEALRRGHRVECWHDYGQPRDGLKGYEFPDVDSVPQFQAGAPTVVPFVGLTELGERFQADPPDAVVCVDPPEPEVAPFTKARWFWIQFQADLSVHPGVGAGFRDAAAVGTFSAWWFKQARRASGAGVLAADARRKAVPVGMPMLDLVMQIDPDRVRWTYSLPRHQPLVLYLPFELRSFPEGFWVRNVFEPSTRLGQGALTFLGPKRGYQGQRADYWSHVKNGWNNRRLVEAVRTFCDRNGAALIVKARRKDPTPTYTKRLARAYFEDRPYHPPVILELLRCASLCIHTYSTAVLESIFCSVPSLCLGPDPRDMDIDSFHGTMIHNGKPGGIYNWPGAGYWRALADAFEGLPTWGLTEFEIVATARRTYVERFLGFDDHRSSARFLDVIERARG